jgi:hypothetical protein
MIVYTARVHTDSGDTYVWVYRQEPTREQVIYALFEYEGGTDEDLDNLDWYAQTTSVFIERTILV